MAVESMHDAYWADCQSCGWQGSSVDRYQKADDAYRDHLKQRHPVLWKRHLASLTEAS